MRPPLKAQTTYVVAPDATVCGSGRLSVVSRARPPPSLASTVSTPVARVVVSIVEYANERDWTFVTLTVVVLFLVVAPLLPVAGVTRLYHPGCDAPPDL